MHRVQGIVLCGWNSWKAGAVEAVTAHGGGIRDGSAGAAKGSGTANGGMPGRSAEYLIAVDLGTTTVAMQAVVADSLRELEAGRKAAYPGEYSCMNPQRRWGSDVISGCRRRKGEAGELAEAVRDVLEEGCGTALR